MAESRKTPPRKAASTPRTGRRGQSAVERRTAARPLRAVGPADTPPAQAKPKTITQAATDGTQLELLVAMRTRIAKAVDHPDCPPRDLASLTKRLGDLAKEIEAIRTAAEEEAADNEAAATPDEAWDESAI